MSKIQKMVDLAIKIARDDSHGYSQRRRWPSQGTDFDCSSLMYYCAHEAGYDVPLSGYTGTMLADFTKAGFTAVPFDGNLSDLEPGDIMLNVQDHTEMYVGNGKFVGAHIAETGDVDGAPGDQTGDEISECNAYVPSFGWDYVLVPPAESSSQPSSKPASKPAATSKETLDGIDIASHQGDLVPGNMTTTDFIIVKSTGGNSYTNPYFRKHADATLKAGKLLGIYHFACERTGSGTAEQEADYFIAAAKPYIGKAALFLDWEADALYKGVSWAKAWLDRVKAKTGVTPGIYMSKSKCREYDWSSVAKAYPLWVAQYADYEPTGYQKDPWTDSYGYGAWSKPIIFQYSSEGHVKGYYGRLDINLFYGGTEDFKKLMGPQGSDQPAEKDGPVKVAQRWLASKGLYRGHIDGRCGNLTKKAYVKAMQEALNECGERLLVDGVAGDLTKRAFSRHSPLKKGSHGSLVEAAQAALEARGYSTGGIDGYYGEKTSDAVRKFQTARSLKADAILGPQTFSALYR